MSDTETVKPVTTLELKKLEVLEMENWFTMFDKTGRGKLDKSELKSVFTAKCWKGSETAFEEIFKKVAKKDGQFVYVEEYKAMLKSFQKDVFEERKDIITHLSAKSECPGKKTVAKRHINTYLADYDVENLDINKIMKEAATPEEPGKIEIIKFVDLLLAD